MLIIHWIDRSYQMRYMIKQCRNYWRLKRKTLILIYPDSPSQRVGGECLKDSESRPCLSDAQLSNAFNEEDLREFDRRVQAAAGKYILYL